MNTITRSALVAALLSAFAAASFAQAPVAPLGAQHGAMHRHHHHHHHHHHHGVKAHGR